MQNPLVSVIIPTYNRANFLALTINSVLDQTYPSIEIFVVDDGSSNSDAQIICDRFERVTYIKIENSGGPAKPRNIGIKKANGKYIAFVDDDDIWLPTKIEKQVQILEKNVNFGLTHCYCQVIDENNKIKNEFIGKPGSVDVKHGDVRMKMMGNWTIMMPTPLITKEIIDKVGFFNEKIPGTFADVEYWTRCSFYTQFYYIDQVLVHYRVHPSNMSKNNKVDIQLPNCLKNVLNEYLEKKIINKNQYKILYQNLIKNQIKMFKLVFFANFHNLNKLDRFWFFSYNKFKLFVYILLFKK